MANFDNAVSHDFLKLSERLGMDELLVQGSGGNTSLKEGPCMWIKASGTQLCNSIKNNIFIPVLHEVIVQNISTFPNDLLRDAILGDGQLRPSIETTLHAMMPHKVVLHTHSVDIIAIAVQQDGATIFSEILRDYKWAWVPYAKPGIDLSTATKIAINGKEVDILVLGNHGLVVGGNNCESAEKTTIDVLSACKQAVRSAAECDGVDDECIDNYNWESDENIATLGADLDSFNMCKLGVLSPDQAVFLGPNMPCIDDAQHAAQCISSYATSLDENPDFIIVKGIGVLVADNAKPSVTEMLNCHAHILRRIAPEAVLKSLGSDQISELLNWDAEKYRQSFVQK